MKNINPDIIAEIRVYLASNGGHEIRFAPEWQVRLPLEIDGQHFDCALLFEEHAVLLPGHALTVGIKFLYPEYVKEHVGVSKSFRLWDGKYFAEGKIVQVLL